MKRIVVVEDETILRELIADELNRHGFSVETANDGAAGWSLIEQTRPDLVLLDLLMPVMSGYDVLTRMHDDAELQKIPCIVISNSGQTEDLNRAYSLGAKAVLIKAEFNPDQVVTRVQNLLEGKGDEAPVVAS